MNQIKRLGWLVRYYWAALRHSTVIDRRRLHAVWEYTQLRQLLRFLDVDCVFDIGANEGQYAEMLRRKAGYTGRIISFEPIPAAAAILREKASKDPNWLIVESAVGENDGSAVFNIMAYSQFSSLSAPKHDEVGAFQDKNVVRQRVEVKAERLEAVLRRYQSEFGFKRPFLKMDTQGFDVKIVRSAAAVMAEFVGLQSELAIAKLYADSIDFREALREYESHGFTLSALVPNNAGHFPHLYEIDCLMLRSDLAAAP